MSGINAAKVSESKPIVNAPDLHVNFLVFAQMSGEEFEMTLKLNYDSNSESGQHEHKVKDLRNKVFEKLKKEQGEKTIEFPEQIVLTELNSSTILNDHDEIPLTQFNRGVGMDYEVWFNVTIKVCWPKIL